MEFSASQAQNASGALIEVRNERAVELEKYQDLNLQENLDEDLVSGNPVFDLFIKAVTEDGIHKLTNSTSTEVSNIYDGLKNCIEPQCKQGSGRRI